MERPADDGNDDRVRAFFAVELDAALRAAADRVARDLAARSEDDVRWVRAESLHVTLRFLGEVATSRLPELARCVGAEVARIVPFRLRLAGVFSFPGSRRPRVVALEVGPAARLATLFAAVERGVVAAGCVAESRLFRPHLTLGRIGRRGRFPDVTAADTPRSDACDVAEVVLFRSELHPSGSRYTPLARLPLGTARAS